MNIEDPTSQQFVLQENDMKALVKFRNPSTDLLFPETNHIAIDLKLVENRIATIKMFKYNIRLRPVRRRESFEELLEEALELFPEKQPKKRRKTITKKQKIVINKNNKIRGALQYIKEGYSAKIVSMYAKLPLGTVYALIKKIREKRGIYCQRKGGKFKLSRENLSWFRGLLDIEKYKRMTIGELRAYFLERFNLPENYITISGLRRSLKKRIKLSWKKVSPYKKKQIEANSINLRYEFVTRIIPQIAEKRNFVFIDECSFNLNMNRNYGWDLSSRRIYTMQPEKSVNYSILAGINKEKIVAYIMTKGSVTTEIYSYFISKLLENSAKDNSLDNTIFVADGNMTHRSIFFKRVFLNTNNFELLPPYSPELNPIELCWSKWKRLVRKGGPLTSEDDLILRINKASKEIKTINCENWLRHTLSFYKRSFLKQSFY